MAIAQSALPGAPTSRRAACRSAAPSRAKEEAPEAAHAKVLDLLDSITTSPKELPASTSSTRSASSSGSDGARTPARFAALPCPNSRRSRGDAGRRTFCRWPRRGRRATRGANALSTDTTGDRTGAKLILGVLLLVFLFALFFIEVFPLVELLLKAKSILASSDDLRFRCSNTRPTKPTERPSLL